MNIKDQSGDYRVLVADDNLAIHEDIRKVLSPGNNAAELDALEAELFEQEQPASAGSAVFAIDSAYQGQEALRLVEMACAAEKPYAVAVIDMRMPPGWDGLETIEHLWREDPELQIIICTAYSDYAWNEMVERLGLSDGLLILKKPFDAIELVQMVNTLSKKWELTRTFKQRLDELVKKVGQQTLRTLDQSDQQSLRESENKAPPVVRQVLVAR